MTDSPMATRARAAAVADPGGRGLRPQVGAAHLG
jgi:hypothetical protein